MLHLPHSASLPFMPSFFGASSCRANSSGDPVQCLHQLLGLVAHHRSVLQPTSLTRMQGPPPPRSAALSRRWQVSVLADDRLCSYPATRHRSRKEAGESFAGPQCKGQPNICSFDKLSDVRTLTTSLEVVYGDTPFSPHRPRLPTQVVEKFDSGGLQFQPALWVLHHPGRGCNQMGVVGFTPARKGMSVRAEDYLRLDICWSISGQQRRAQFLKKLI